MGERNAARPQDKPTAKERIQNFKSPNSPFEDIPQETLLEKEKQLDDEINQEVDKVKMTSDFVSTLHKLDAQMLENEPIQINSMIMEDGVEADAMIMEEDLGAYAQPPDTSSLEAQPSSLEQFSDRRQGVNDGDSVSARSG